MRVVAREGALLAGGAQAILLQVAHPAVGRGSPFAAFADRPLDRLRATLTYVYAVTYGTPEEARAVASMVTECAPGRHRRRIPRLRSRTPAVGRGHALRHGRPRVRGTLRPASTGRWPTRSTSSTPCSVRRSNCRPTTVDTDRAAFRRYWADVVATLEVSDDARRVARDLLHPRRPLALRPAMPLNRFLTATWLPNPDAPGVRHPLG